MTERNRGCDWEQLNRRYQLLTPIALRSFEGLREESGSEGRSQGKKLGRPTGARDRRKSVVLDHRFLTTPPDETSRQRCPRFTSLKVGIRPHDPRCLLGAGSQDRNLDRVLETTQ
jgi:hypothetical protein